MKGKSTSAVSSWRGSTLTEMCIVIALLATVSTMIVSFSALVSASVESQRSQYTFLEEASAVKEQLSGWLAHVDSQETACTVTTDQLSADPTGASVTFNAPSQVLVLTYADGTVNRLDAKAVRQVDFKLSFLSPENAIVKCTVTGAHSQREQQSISFALSLRCGSFTTP